MLVEPCWKDGRRDWLRDQLNAQSGCNGLPLKADLSGGPQPNGWLSVDGRGSLSNEYVEEGLGDDEPLRTAPNPNGSAESAVVPKGSGFPKFAGFNRDEENIPGSMRRPDELRSSPISLASLELRGNRWLTPLAQFP